MKSFTKVIIHKKGSYDKLTLSEQPPLSPKPDEVIIDVKAIGVNYADCMVRMGLYQSAKDYVGWPITPGFEVSGTIIAIGEQITDVQIGDNVLALTRFGGYTSQLAVKRPYVFHLPTDLDHQQAAGFMVVYLTAWFALFELAHPRPGAKILIHSAAGGVGSALVQLAKIAKCEVTGVVGSTHKVENVKIWIWIIPKRKWTR